MRVLFAALAAAVFVAGCDEHKPRLLSDCGDSCGDAGVVVDAGGDGGVVPDSGADDAGVNDAGVVDAGDGGDGG